MRTTGQIFLPAIGMCNMRKNLAQITEGIKETRFFDQVKINLRNGCWEWVGTLSSAGYGELQLGSRKHRKKHDLRYFKSYAHRYSYEMHFRTKIPAGLYCCHHCDNPKCVNPSHLFLGTNSDNQLDCVKKGRAKKRALISSATGKIIAQSRSRNDLGRFI